MISIFFLVSSPESKMIKFWFPIKIFSDQFIESLIRTHMYEYEINLEYVTFKHICATVIVVNQHRQQLCICIRLACFISYRHWIISLNSWVTHLVVWLIEFFKHHCSVQSNLVILVTAVDIRTHIHSWSRARMNTPCIFLTISRFGSGLW